MGKYVKSFLEEKLHNTGIKIISGKNKKHIKRDDSFLWKQLSIPIKNTPVYETVCGDMDLIAIKNDIPIVIISYKLSLHGRFTETLFWSLLFKMLSRIRVVLATADAGAEQGK